MISVKQTLLIHERAIKIHGGSNGVRDQGSLESALARPFQTFDGEELYQSFEEKAAAIAESIIINHPFVDGNKRTGYILMEAILKFGNINIISSDAEIYKMVIDISTGDLRFDEIVIWLKANTAKR